MHRSHIARTWSLRAKRRRIAAVALTLGGLFGFVLGAAPASATTTRRTTASAISTASSPTLGSFLVSGTTVYALKPSKTACRAKCLAVWPPVLLPQGVMAATASSGVDASKLGTAAAAHGARQVTYAGKRLYWYVKDKAPGQVNGNVTDKWGKWYTIETAKATAGSPANVSNGGTGF